jgi:[NiFe] hydrogenase diaphorase moiety small subunit
MSTARMSSRSAAAVSAATTDKAAHVCPVGAILPKHRGYEQPIGERLYDLQPISVVGDVAVHEQEGD